MAELRELLLTGTTIACAELGELLCESVDLRGPAFLAFGSDPDEQFGFAVALKPGPLPAPPDWLESVPKRPGVLTLRLRKGSSQRWFGARGECEISSTASGTGLLVCGATSELLTRWSDFLTSLVAGTKPLPTAELRIYSSIFDAPLRTLDRRDPTEAFVHDALFDHAHNLDEIRLTAKLRDDGLELAAELRYRATSDAISFVAAGARTPERPLPPTFDELPQSTLLAISLTGLDQAAASPALRGFVQGLSSALNRNPDAMSNAFEKLYQNGSPLGFAMGLEFLPGAPEPMAPEAPAEEPAPERSELEPTKPQSRNRGDRALLAQTSEPSEPSIARESSPRLQGTPWYLFRVEGEQASWRAELESAFRAAPQLSAQSATRHRLASAAERSGLPAETLYLLPSNDESLYWAIVPREKALLVVGAGSGDGAKRIVREAIAGGSRFQAYFRPAGVGESAGLGFMSSSLGGGLGATNYSGISRERAERLRVNQDRVRPAPLRYEVLRGVDGSSLASVKLELSNQFVEAWLGDFAIGVDDDR